MKRIAFALLLTSPFLFSCAHDYKPYTPATAYEKVESPRATVNVYPDDVRTNLDQYTNTIVAWAGVVKDTTARDRVNSDVMRATTVLEHHYFDWQENRKSGDKQYLISPRGEGAFQVEWDVRRKNPQATTADVDKYAGPGKLAIVYGTPQRVTDNGVVILKYRYLRIIDSKNFNINTFSYGRVGEPYKYVGKLGQ